MQEEENFINSLKDMREDIFFFHRQTQWHEVYETKKKLLLEIKNKERKWKFQ